jgi:hypothetical protein
LDFACAAMFFTQTFKYAKFSFMVLDQYGTNLVANLLLAKTFPFYLFLKPYIFPTLFICEWSCYSSRCKVKSLFINFTMWTWLVGVKVESNGLMWIKEILFPMRWMRRFIIVTLENENL